MKPIRKILPLVIATALASTSAFAQSECVELKGTPPGMYTTTDQGATVIIQEDGTMVEIGAGQSGFADESGAKCIKRVPQFMDWPCATDAARSRKFATYSLDDLAPENRAREIVRRYFEVPEVIEPIPNWMEGQYHMVMSMDEILQFTSEEYWYHPNPNRPVMDPKRPKVLLISLYVGTNTVVVDSHTLNYMNEEFGDSIPVAFIFNDSNVVPISYFGPNVSLEEVLTANMKRGINVAGPPMWELGDYNIRPSVAELQKYFDIPALADIPPERQAKLQAELEEFGFTKKPVFVTIPSGSDQVLIDQPERVAVAASMGMKNIPVNAIIIEQDYVAQRCGPGVPASFGEGSSSIVSGETTPDGGASLPPGSIVAPPPPESNASDS